ncbi:MAG: hypothetical protein ACKO96_11700 [Flammeovirgaceae bacterium]
MSAGMGDAIGSNFTYGIVPETNPNTQAYSNNYANGQKAGRYLTLAFGVDEAALGFLEAGGSGAGALLSGGTLTLPAAAGVAQRP